MSDKSATNNNGSKRENKNVANSSTNSKKDAENVENSGKNEKSTAKAENIAQKSTKESDSSAKIEHPKLDSSKKRHQQQQQQHSSNNVRTAFPPPFYVYSQNMGGASRQQQQWAPIPLNKFFANSRGGPFQQFSPMGADYHPRQQRSQQFMVRYQHQQHHQDQPFYRSRQQQQQQMYWEGGPARRRQQLSSCNEEILLGQRRKSRSINGDDVSSPQQYRMASTSPHHRKAQKYNKQQRNNNKRNNSQQRGYGGRNRSSHSESVFYDASDKMGSEAVVQGQQQQEEEQFGSCESVGDDEKFVGDDSNLSATTKKRSGSNGLTLPLPQRRLHTLSGTVPSVGYSPVWGGPTMCLNCFEFFDLPDQAQAYVEHLLSAHKLVVAEIELIVDLKRYIEYWRHRLADSSLDKILTPIEPTLDDPLYGKVDKYYLLSAEKMPEDMQIRQRLAMRRLEEVLACQQRERDDQTFARQCLFCRYQATGNRSKLVHHLYMIHHLNLGSPDNLVFVSEYLDILEDKLQRGVCIYCEIEFSNQHDLNEHMREKGHREVNPNNSYYDKFYVINYLELGKKWIDVLAEDFEDTMPTFLDSEEEEEEQTWNEWEEDTAENEQRDVLCLLCDQASRDLDSLLQHMKEVHEFDLKQVVKSENMGFYERVKFINYIRTCCHYYECFVCGKDDLHSWTALSKHLDPRIHAGHTCKIPERKMWDKDEFLVPTFENDSLLCLLDDLVENDELDDHEKARRSLPSDPAILDNGPIIVSGVKEGYCNANGVNKTSDGHHVIVAEDPPDLSLSILSDKQLRDELN